ncbi:hypothetical protein UFOVP308_46 [uncultured Caudovirales phage]|uniref:Portal protein n=1 Tax=uncultured Caudovirales phage TaxID=2100421 RepID=A0A6J5LPX8_9CAUD|nr:hypothetical protein UFOVP308_46 [uncultured Caudovirales phage]
MEFQEPTDSDKELVSFVVNHCDRWRDYRDTNHLSDWLEFERIFNGEWDIQDKTRESERSRIVTPATQQAVETRHAEIMEAIFGQGEFFDIQDDIRDVNNNPLDVAAIKAQLMEDFKIDKIRKSIDQIELLAEIYGTGIGEIIVKTEKVYVPSTQPIPGQVGQAAIGVVEQDRIGVKIVPVNPRNFLFDPNGTSIDDCMGVAIEKYVSIHKIVKGQEDGIYRKVEIGTDSMDNDLEPTQEITQYEDDKVKVLTYYGLVPREYIEQLENESEVEDLFPEDSIQDDYSDLVEAIIVIANDNVLLKAEKNPYMMKDRPILAYQDDTVPNRLLGRGTVEKAYNSQKAIDAQVRSHLDSLALTTSPMIAMDATRLPRGAKFEVKPGKAILTNGNPNEILFPFKFGNTDGSNLTTAKEFERMLLQATGTLDSQGMVSAVSRDAGQGGISMAVASIIKKYKRTLVNFQEDFMIPFIMKAAYRYMQFDPERYPTVDMKFIPTAALGIIAREHEQQQFISLLQTLGPNTPVLPVILKGIMANSSLSNRYELIQMLDEMSKVDPQAQQMQQAQQQLAMQAAQAQIAVQTTQAEQNRAEAQKLMTETQLMPQEIQAKVLSSATKNLPTGNEPAEFDKRVKIAELMLKEADIKNKSKIVEMQMSDKMEKAFLDRITSELK